MWEVFRHVCHKRLPNHNLGEFAIIYVDCEINFQAFLISYTQK